MVTLDDTEPEPTRTDAPITYDALMAELEASIKAAKAQRKTR